MAFIFKSILPDTVILTLLLSKCPTSLVSSTAFPIDRISVIRLSPDALGREEELHVSGLVPDVPLYKDIDAVIHCHIRNGGGNNNMLQLGSS